MQIPMRKLKESVYGGRLKRYFQAGQLYHSFLERTIEQRAERIPFPGRSYFRLTMGKPDIRAYHEVQGQLALIDADIFDLVGEEYTERDLICAFDVGNFFYQAKLVDERLSGSDMPLDEKVEILEKATGPLLGGEPSSDRDLNSIAQIRRSIPFSVNEDILRICFKTRSAVSRALYPLEDEERLTVSSEIGSLMGDAMFSIMGEHYEMPLWSREFLIQQGLTANLFDDVKDFCLDRRIGGGYSLSFYPRLVKEFVSNFYGIHDTFPTSEEARRFWTFMTLGIGFQAEELLGLKERT